MFLAKLSINRPVMMTVIILVFLIFGTLAYRTLNLNQMPDVQIPYITISTIYPGAGPKEIETQITEKIEDAVATVSEIKKLESYSLDGVSIIVLEFALSKNVDIANQEVKDKIDAIMMELPDDAENPLIQKVDLQAFPVVDLVLTGDMDKRELYELADKKIKDRFAQIKGVAKVDLVGGQKREIHVEMDKNIVSENMISMPQMLQILAAQNVDIPGGYFSIKDQEYTVRLNGEFEDLNTIREQHIPTAFGPKKLRQVAKVVDKGEKVRQKAIFFDMKDKVSKDNVVRLSIIKASEGNAVDVAESVINAVDKIAKDLPVGAELSIVQDGSIFIRSTVEDTVSNIVLGVIFTSIVLLIFLHDLRSTIIVAMSMPTSIISTFLTFQMFDMTLNMMSLMGISVSVGVLVANSVVVLENIFRHKNMGKNNKDAAYIGTREVTVAVLASTLTNLVIFIPIASMSSMVGMFLAELALAAVFATIFSLIMSFTLTPMLASWFLPKNIKKGPISRFFDDFDAKIENIYKNMLSKVLKNKIISTLSFLFVFVILGIVMVVFGSKLGGEFLPTMDNSMVNVIVELPAGYNLNETANTIEDIQTKIATHKEVKHTITTLGKKDDMNLGTNLASMFIHLVDPKERQYSLTDMIDIFTVELSDVPNAKITVMTGEQSGPAQYPIEFVIQGQEIDKLEEIKLQVIEACRDIEGLMSFDNSSRSGKPEITVVPKRDILNDVGLNVTTLALSLRASIEGMVSSQYREFGNEYDIKVLLAQESTNTPEKIGNIPIVSSMGSYKLRDLADIKNTKGVTNILHQDKFKAIKFFGFNTQEVSPQQIVAEVEAKIDEMGLPDGYQFKWGGNTEMMNEMFADFIFAFIMAILLTYLLLAAILEHFLQPIYILLTIPMALIGVIFSLYITDIAIGITSLMAIVMLIGIVVNNAILMLDYTNQLRREQGLSAKQALLEACPVKLKPIIMSTTAIILGMLPMAMGLGDAGVEMRIPLGVVSIGGLLVSTVLALFIIPAFYFVFTFRKKNES